MIISYLIWENQCSYEQALDLVQSIRPNVQPNDSFEIFLKENTHAIQNIRVDDSLDDDIK